MEETSTIEQRATLGGLDVSRVGFGAMRLTGHGIWGEPRDEQAAAAVLRRAVELGIELIDTADSYGPEVSERLISQHLRPYPANLVIATKGGYRRPGPGRWQPDGRPEHLRGACDGSLRRLRLDRIDLYQLHTPDPAVPFEESVGALAELWADGKIRCIGLSNVSIDQIERARAIVPIVSVQNRYSLTDRAGESVLRHCEQEGIVHLCWLPLGRGSLNRSAGALRRMAEAHGATPGQIALAWILHHSPAALPIPGTSSVRHLEDNAAAREVRLSPEEVASLDEFRLGGVEAIRREIRTRAWRALRPLRRLRAR